MIKLTIVTPQGRIFDADNIVSVTLPTKDGVITIKEDHISLLTILVPGGIEVDLADGTTEYLAVSRGILEVRSESHAEILADTAERAEKIDIERAEEAKKKAEEYLLQSENLADVEFAMLQAKIEKELARIQIGKRWKNR